MEAEKEKCFQNKVKSQIECENIDEFDYESVLLLLKSEINENKFRAVLKLSRNSNKWINERKNKLEIFNYLGESFLKKVLTSTNNYEYKIFVLKFLSFLINEKEIAGKLKACFCKILYNFSDFVICSTELASEYFDSLFECAGKLNVHFSLVNELGNFRIRKSKIVSGRKLKKEEKRDSSEADVCKMNIVSEKTNFEKVDNSLPQAKLVEDDKSLSSLDESGDELDNEWLKETFADYSDSEEKPEKEEEDKDAHISFEKNIEKLLNNLIESELYLRISIFSFNSFIYFILSLFLSSSFHFSEESFCSFFSFLLNSIKLRVDKSRIETIKIFNKMFCFAFKLDDFSLLYINNNNNEICSNNENKKNFDLEKFLIFFDDNKLQDIAKVINDQLKSKLKREYQNDSILFFVNVLQVFSLRWMNSLSFETFCLISKLTSIQIRVFLDEFLRSKTLNFSKKDLSEDLQHFIFFELLGNVLLKESFFIEENSNSFSIILLGKLFDSFEKCIKDVFSFFSEIREMKLEFDKDIVNIVSLCCRVTGIWMIAEPLHLQFDYRRALSNFCYLTTPEQFSFLLPSIKYIDNEDCIEIDGLVDKLVEFILYKYDIKLSIRQSIDMEDSCILASKYLTSMILFSNKIIGIYVKKDKSYFEKTRLSYSALFNKKDLETTSWLYKIRNEKPSYLPSLSSLSSFCEWSSSDVNEDVLINCYMASVLFYKANQAEINEKFYQKEMYWSIQEIFREDSKKACIFSKSHLKRAEQICLSAALIGKHINQKALLSILQVDEIIFIWDNLVEEFFLLLRELLCFSSDFLVNKEESIKYRECEILLQISTIILMCVHCHPFLNSIIFFHIRSIQSKGKNLMNYIPTWILQKENFEEILFENFGVDFDCKNLKILLNYLCLF